MIDFRPTREGFTLYHKGQPVLKHSHRDPCIGLGGGSCTITMPHGMYHLKRERLLWWREAEEFSIDSTHKAQNLIRITFPDLLTLDIQEEPEGLRIVPIPSTAETTNRCLIRLTIPQSQPVFGCGEQFSHLDLRGKTIPLWVSEPGIGRGPNYVRLLANLHSGRGGSRVHTYFPQSTFVTASGQWAMLDCTAFSRFDFVRPGYCEITTHSIPSAVRIGQADNLQMAVGTLSASIGRQPALPDWIYQGMVLGLQGGRAVVAQKLKDALAAGIPVSAIWCQDWQGIRMTPYGKQLFWNWDYDRALYPDLPGFIDKLHAKGIRFLGYNNPFLSTDAPLYAEGAKHGYFVQDPRGHQPYITSTTTFPVALVDLCNHDACVWYKDIIKRNMLAIGLDGWMADFGEYLPPDGELHKGLDPYLEHNRYPVRWAELNAQAVREAGREQETVYFCRSGFTGSAPYIPLVWAGDQAVNFLKDSGLPSVVPAGISSSLSGLGYWHFDIGGFFSFAWIRRSRELLMRSCELAAFTQVMRTHEGINPTVNAQFDSDSELLYHFARMARIHKALLPYHQEVSRQYQTAGIPPLQPVLINSQTGRRAAAGQYLYGEDLLVAPILKARARKRRVWLPEGLWVDFWSGQELGEGVHTVFAATGHPPVFIRAASPFKILCREIAQKEM